ncbi:hypothetical protein IEQ34_012403 [Dendrobium chrysotoxum]|uniref:Uncharacterized protein n=1 Tax=Dendrobium chrysotoxum TaxID=161865 RepID=A0AAV7GVL5_DENCH|nr:hypothetical protein IEQ34_012403 [Dendrobium chrysotoxum]
MFHNRDFEQVAPAAKKFRFNGIQPELEQKLETMFSHIVATGDNVWIPNSGILPPELTTTSDIHLMKMTSTKLTHR